MTFELKTVTECRLSHINIRRELHGEEHVPAMDLSMSMEGGNELLDLLHPKLRETMYCNRAATAGQETLPEVLAVLPNLRFPSLNNCKFSWNKGERHKGYNLILDYGLGPEKSNVDLDGCTVANWRFEIKEGGTVVLGWVVQYAGDRLTSDVRGLLSGLTDEPIFVQLLATPGLTVHKGKPKAVPVDDGDGMGEGEDMFAGGGEPPEDEGDGEGEDSPEAALMRAAEGAGA